MIAHQSLTAVIAAINDPTTKFIPGILLARIDPSAPETQYWKGTVQAFATDSLRRGGSRGEAQARLASTDPGDHDLLAEVYGFFGIVDPKAVPGDGMREQADKLLRGIRVDK